MRVEWAEGRRALAHWEGQRDWVEVIGVVGRIGPVWAYRGGMLATMVNPLHAVTALLPDQCSRCFEVDDHEQGCMVDANLARGVPAFWAPWAMVDPVPPSVWTRFNGLGLYGLKHGAGQDPLACTLVTRIGDPCDSWVAIGPDGPTLEPWEGQS